MPCIGLHVSGELFHIAAPPYFSNNKADGDFVLTGSDRYRLILPGIAACGVACSISGILLVMLSLLVAPLGRDLGWTPPQIYLALTFATVTTIVAAPLTGRMIDLYGARRVIVISFLAEALLLLSFQHLNNNLYLFYLRYAALALFAMGATAIGFSVPVSRWSGQHRGLALGVMLSGVGIGGALWSLVIQWLFERVGWRETFAWLAMFIAAVITPLMLLTVRDAPKHEHAHASMINSGMTLRGAWRDRRYWLMLPTFVLLAMASFGVSLNLLPLLHAQGHSAALAAKVQASMWAAMTVGRIGGGWLLDRWFAPHVMLLFIAPALLGMVMLSGDIGNGPAFIAAMLVGLLVGAEIDGLTYLTGSYFGLRHFGTIYASLYAAYVISTSMGSYLLATLAMRTDYGVALWTSIAMLIVAGALLLRLPRVETQPRA